MLVFWFLSWLGDRFYKAKNHKASENVYECGFSSTHALRVSINFGFFVIALLLILYDIEFLFLIPVYFNLASLGALGAAVYWVFVLFMAFSFMVDWETVALRWIK
jgi:NADH-quinone oxidoreductase subunit A